MHYQGLSFQNRGTFVSSSCCFLLKNVVSNNTDVVIAGFNGIFGGFGDPLPRLVFVIFWTSEKPGTICDHKASWDRLERRHEGEHYKCVMFQTAIIVSEMELIFTFAEFLKTLMHLVCLLSFEQINPEYVFLSWFAVDRAMFLLNPSERPLEPLWS